MRIVHATTLTHLPMCRRADRYGVNKVLIISNERELRKKLENTT